MNVQVIDKQPSGIGTEFAVGSGASLSGTIVTVFAVSVSLEVQRFDTIIRIAPHLTVGSLSATERIIGGNEIEQRFKMLVSRWRDETRILSSPTKTIAHPDYLRIISMGKIALPFILRELRDHGGHWYAALEAITGIDPIPTQAYGYVPEMKRTWLLWGQSHGLI